MAASELALGGWASWDAVPAASDVNTRRSPRLLQLAGAAQQGNQDPAASALNRQGRVQSSEEEEAAGEREGQEEAAGPGRPRQSASNKRKRRVALVDAELQSIERIQAASLGPRECHKSCPYKNCMSRIVKAVSAADLT